MWRKTRDSQRFRGPWPTHIYRWGQIPLFFEVKHNFNVWGDATYGDRTVYRCIPSSTRQILTRDNISAAATFLFLTSPSLEVSGCAQSISIDVISTYRCRIEFIGRVTLTIFTTDSPQIPSNFGDRISGRRVIWIKCDFNSPKTAGLRRRSVQYTGPVQ